MSTLEAALRGGTVAVLLLIMLLVARDLRTSRLSRYSALLFLGAAAFAIDSAPGFWTLDVSLKLPIHILSTTTPAVFWVMSAALFDDDFKARWYHALVWLWLAGLAWREMYGWPSAVVAVQEASSLLFVAFGVWHALAGRAGDLVEWRRQLRVEFAVITALYIVSIIVSQRIWPGTLGKAPYSLFNAIGLMAFIFVYAWLRLSLLIRQQLAPASLQTARMAQDGAIGGSAPCRPMRASRTVSPAGVEAQTGDGEEDVIVARVDGDPLARTRLAVVAKAFRRHRSVDAARGTQQARRCTGTVVAVVERMRVAAAPHVGKSRDAIARGDRGPHALGRGRRRDRVAVAQNSRLTRHMPVNVRRGSGTAGEQREEKKCVRLHGLLENRTRESLPLGLRDAGLV